MGVSTDEIILDRLLGDNIIDNVSTILFKVSNWCVQRVLDLGLCV